MKKALVQLPAGLEIEKIDVLSEDHLEFPGQFAVCLKNAADDVAWGFADNKGAAMTDAIAAFNGDFGLPG